MNRIINSEELSEMLPNFDIECRECGSTNVTLDIAVERGADQEWMNITFICEGCQHADDIWSMS